MVSRFRSAPLLGAVVAALVLSGYGQSGETPAAASGTPATSASSAADTGGDSKDRPLSVSGTTYSLTVTDALGEKVTLPDRPKRVAMLTGTSMSIWYDLGGAAIASVAVTDNIKLSSWRGRWRTAPMPASVSREPVPRRALTAPRPASGGYSGQRWFFRFPVGERKS